MGAYSQQESALRASLQAEYGIRLLRHGGGRTEPERSPFEVADLIVNLPGGCALWVATGGPAALTTTDHLLREAIFHLDVLDWHAHDPKGQQPRRIPLPKPASETQTEKLHHSAKAEKWAAKQARHQRGE